MKISYVILTACVITIAGAVTWQLTSGDRPSAATQGEALKKQELLEATQPLKLSVDASADATPLYQALIELYDQYPGVLPDTKAHDELTEKASALLVEAARAGRVEHGFIDRHIPVEIGATPGFEDAVEVLYEIAVIESANRYARGETGPAKELAIAVWVLGERMFNHNDRLYSKIVGLDAMESAGSVLFEIAGNDPLLNAEDLRAASERITAIRRAWQPKLQIVMGVSPPIGDLVQIAEHDEDLAFRVEATLRLGIFQHAAGGIGNKRMVRRAIGRAVESNNEMIAQAGLAAQALTLEEKRRLY